MDLTFETWPIERCIDYARNPRKNDHAVDKVAAAIREFGFRVPIVAKSDGLVVDGHLRLKAAKKLGLKEVPVVLADDMTDAQIKAFRLSVNKVAELAEWDNELLGLEIMDLKDMGFDIDLIGFDADEINALFPEEPTAGLTDEDAVPEMPEVPVTVEGDVWVLGRHRLMCGDSTSIDAVERLMDGRKADCLFTDPPYGYKYESNHQNKHSVLMNDDKILDFAPVAHAVMCENSSVYICGSFQTIGLWIDYISQTFAYKNLIVWKKNNWSMGDLKGAFAGQHELIIFAHKGRVELIGGRDPDVWSFNREPPKVHPTQKPVDLVEYALSKVKSGVTLDLFGGSGSTLIACEKTARDCRLMELDPKYCDVIIKRWQDFTGQQATLEATGQTYDELKAEREAA
jgi:DNA modification methylase